MIYEVAAGVVITLLPFIRTLNSYKRYVSTSSNFFYKSYTPDEKMIYITLRQHKNNDLAHSFCFNAGLKYL